MTKHVLAGAVLASLVMGGVATAQAVFTKVQVGDRIRKVEDGVDEFRKWAENRAEQGSAGAQTAKASGRTRGRTATEAQKEGAREKKDELEDNQVLVRGKYGTQAERYWGVLRSAINDLARCYNLTPLGV